MSYILGESDEVICAHLLCFCEDWMRLKTWGPKQRLQVFKLFVKLSTGYLIWWCHQIWRQLPVFMLSYRLTMYRHSSQTLTWCSDGHSWIWYKWKKKLSEAVRKTTCSRTGTWISLLSRYNLYITYYVIKEFILCQKPHIFKTNLHEAGTT